MWNWLIEKVHRVPLTWESALIGAIIFAVTFAGSTAIVSFLLVRLPATYFQEGHTRDFWIERHPFLRWSGIVGKNLLGLLLIIAGVIMAVPGIPGPGVLTILLGIMLMDFPGKHRLEHKLVSRPSVLSAINQLRGKFGKPPLVLDGEGQG